MMERCTLCLTLSLHLVSTLRRQVQQEAEKQIETGMEGANFALSALESACSLIKGEKSPSS
jgi:hypothetical protein